MRSILEIPLEVREEHRYRLEPGTMPQKVPEQFAVDAGGHELYLPPSDVATLCYFVSELRNVGLLDAGDVLVQTWPGHLHFRVGQTDGEIRQDGSLALWGLLAPSSSKANEYEAASRRGEPPVSNGLAVRSGPKATPNDPSCSLCGQRHWGPCIATSSGALAPT